MYLNINLDKIPKELNLNCYFALIKVYMQLQKAPFNYGALLYVDRLAELGYLDITKDANGIISHVNLKSPANELIRASFNLSEQLQQDTFIKDLEIADKLAKEMIELYPKGKKDGKWPFRSSVATIATKLKTFSVKYKISLYKDYDNIIKATSKYVNAFENDKNGMSLIKYFIDKQQSGSILLDYMDQLDDDNAEDTKLSNTTLEL